VIGIGLHDPRACEFFRSLRAAKKFAFERARRPPTGIGCS